VATFARTFAARPENVAEARRAVLDIARRSGVPAESLPDIRLAVSEAVSNAVVHGYRNGSEGDVTVVTEAEDSQLRVVVRDEGCGMSPHVGSPGAGLGLPLIADLTESVAVRPLPSSGGTEVCMTFRLPVPVSA
jgi:serine/threonine-protein kinase RsbW/stage II sporulation protein AB (anti-sigma F factor)